MNEITMNDPAECDDLLDIPNADLNAWLSVLKRYQSLQITALIDRGLSPEGAVEAWLSANGPDRTRGFGGAVRSGPFLERFRDEFKKFVCGDKKYSKDRSQLMGQVSVVNTTFVSTVSIAIAANIGAAPALLVPAVAICLYIVGKVGLNAWCQGNKPEKDPVTPPSDETKTKATTAEPPATRDTVS